RGEGDLNPRAQAHWISNPAPYQARRSPQGRIHWEPAINVFGATCIPTVQKAAGRTGLYRMRVSGPRTPQIPAPIAVCRLIPGVLCWLLEWNALAPLPFVRDVCAVLGGGMGRLSGCERTLCGRNRSNAEARRFALDSRLSPPAPASPHSRASSGRPHRILPPHPVPAVRRLSSPPVAQGGPRGTPRCGPDWIPHVRLCPGVPRQRLARPGAREPDRCARRGPPGRPSLRLPAWGRRRGVRIGGRRPVRRALPRANASGDGTLEALVLDLPPRLHERDSAATRRFRAVP